MRREPPDRRPIPLPPPPDSPGHVGMTNGVGVADKRTDIVDIKAKHLSGDHCHDGARATYVNRAGHNAHAAVSMDVDRGRRLEPTVTPKTRSHSASTIRAIEF